MTDEAGFQIGKRLYPFPSRFRMGDPVLVEQLTGITWPQFVDRLPDDDETPDDPIAMLGMVGVAVAQGNPTWRRDRVVRYVTELNMEDVEVVGPQLEDAEDDASPPLAADSGEQTSNGSPPQSLSVLESASVQSSQSATGAAASAT